MLLPDFEFLGFKAVDKQTMNLVEGSEDFGFSNSVLLDREVYTCLK